MAVEVQVNDPRAPGGGEGGQGVEGGRGRGRAGAGASPAAGFSDVDAAAVVADAARATLRDRGVEEGELSITLLDDEGMAAMNRQWKGREEPTDVLAFALHEEGEPLIGDVYVGVDRAVEQAAELAEPLARELARLAIHGTLHTLGWEHPEEGREETEMWRHQERILAELEGV